MRDIFKLRKSRNGNDMKYKEIKDLLSRAVEIHNTLAGVKPMYKELDDIILLLRLSGTTHFCAGGYNLTIVDNFAESNVSFKVAAIRQYDIRVEPVA
jgi:hypothetical protein